MDTKVKERLRWFQILTSLYEIATPHIGAFTGLECRAIEERAIDIEALDQNARFLRQVLTVINNIPDPPTGELATTARYFETALSNCLKVSESLIKYVQRDELSRENEMLLDSLITSLALAREYSESTQKKLNAAAE